MDTLLSLAETARRLGLSRQRIDALVKAGDLATVDELVPTPRITASEVARFARLNRPQGGAGQKIREKRARKRNRLLTRK